MNDAGVFALCLPGVWNCTNFQGCLSGMATLLVLAPREHTGKEDRSEIAEECSLGAPLD